MLSEIAGKICPAGFFNFSVVLQDPSENKLRHQNFVLSGKCFQEYQ